jgi:transposase-like protein
MERFFKFILIWCRNGLGLDIADTNDVSKNTSTAWCSGLREVIQDYLIENREMLGGLDDNGCRKIVEIDESLFFRRKYNRGRHTEANWVFGMLERGSRKCALFPVPDRSAATLLPIIRANCHPETIIISDCWSSYRSFFEDPSFYHLTVNHSLNFVSPDSPLVHTQNIENTWMHAKKSKRYRSGGSRDDLEGYLYEFIFKKKFPRKTRLNRLIIILSEMLSEQ